MTLFLVGGKEGGRRAWLLSDGVTVFVIDYFPFYILNGIPSGHQWCLPAMVFPQLLPIEGRTMIHTYTHSYIHAYIHLFIHSYIHKHTYIHTRIHTYTHIHAHACVCIGALFGALDWTVTNY